MGKFFKITAKDLTPGSFYYVKPPWSEKYNLQKVEPEVHDPESLKKYKHDLQRFSDLGWLYRYDKEATDDTNKQQPGLNRTLKEARRSRKRHNKNK